MAHPAEILMDITSANTIITIQADPIIPSPVQLQNFGPDGILVTEEMTIAEARMGPDGGLAMGYTPNPVGVSLTFEANSPSQQTMFDLSGAIRANRRIYDVTITADCPSLKKRYIFERGGLISSSVMPNPKKTHDPTNWKFQFATVREETIG